MNNKAIPTKKQLEWAELELGVLIHYLLDAYSDRDVKYDISIREKMPPSVFAPTKLDTDQWLRAAVKMGAKYAVLVTNHCTGFSLWQTKVNDFSIKNSPWKNGKGDIVKDFLKSCEKYNVKAGLYYNIPKNAYYGIVNESDTGTKEYREYIKVVEQQLYELWTEYGELFEIWFDGGCLPVEKGGPDLFPILERYQPQAVCFQGPKEHLHNVRWVGNERGLAPVNCWSSTNNNQGEFTGTIEDDYSGTGSPDGKYWLPAEADMPNRSFDAAGGGWAWRAGEQKYCYSTEHLLDCYCRSVGRNANLLMGMAISSDGLFEDEEQFENFGNRIKEIFSNPKASCSNVRGVKAVISKKSSIQADYIVICEDISQGHNIKEYSVFADGVKIYESNCVGHKRIIPLKNVTAKEFILCIDKYDEIPVIRDFSIY